MIGQAALSLLLAASFADGAENPKDLIEFADLAMSAPPEIAADALIQVAGDSRNSDNAWRIELLDRAFRLAASAKFPYRLVAAVGAARNTDSEAGIAISSLDRGLDTLSLQTQAATMMLAIDRARGRELFEGLGLLRFQPLACRDALMPDAAAYYNLVKTVYERGFTRKEIEDGKHFELLQREMNALHSPFQLEPAARLLIALKLKKEELAELTAAYASALRRMEVDDRSFSGGVQHGFPQTFFGLVKLSRDSAISILPLVDAYRSYLTRHAGRVRCADTAAQREGATAANAAKMFNRNLVGAPPEVIEIRPISEEELKPAKVDGEAFVGDYWEGAKTKELLQAFRVLRFGPLENQRSQRPTETSDAQRRTAEWEAQARRLLEDLDGWSKDHGESAGAHFHQSSLLYRALIDLIPPGSLRDGVLETAVSFLAMSSMQRDNPPEWLHQVKVLQRIPGAREALARNGNASLTVALRSGAESPR